MKGRIEHKDGKPVIVYDVDSATRVPDEAEVPVAPKTDVSKKKGTPFRAVIDMEIRMVLDTTFSPEETVSALERHARTEARDRWNNIVVAANKQGITCVQRIRSVRVASVSIEPKP